MERIRSVRKVLLQPKKLLYVSFNATSESVNCSLFLKNLDKYFRNSTYKNSFVKHMESLPLHLSEKFIGDNLSITPIVLTNSPIIGIAQSFLKISVIVIAFVENGLSCPLLRTSR